MPQMPWVAAAALSPLAPDIFFLRGEFARARDGFRAQGRVEGELRALLRLDRWQEAIALGERALPAQPEREGLLALAYLRGGLPLQAQQSAVWAIQRNPNAYWPQVALGALAQRWDADPARAVGYLSRATQQRPELPEGWLALLQAATDRRDEARALAALTALAPQGYPFAFWSRPLRQNGANASRFDAAFPHGELFRPASALPPSLTLPLKRDRRGMLYFDAEIDGQPLRLLYDTGGGRHLVLTPAAVARLRPTFVAQTLVTGLQGQSEGSLYRAERLRLGELELRALLIESAPGNLGGFDGLIGWQVFGELAQQLNLRRLTLTLGRPLEEPSSRRITLPLHLIQEQPVVGLRCRLRESGRTLALWGILDTGALQDFFSLRAGSQLTPQARPSQLSGAMGIGQTHPRIETRLLDVGFDLLSGGDQLLTTYTQATAASFLDRVHNPATGFEHGLLLGMDFLSRFALIELDPVGRTVKLVPQ